MVPQLLRLARDPAMQFRPHAVTVVEAVKFDLRMFSNGFLGLAMIAEVKVVGTRLLSLAASTGRWMGI